MQHANPLSLLLTALAGLYAAENRAGGTQAARALLQASTRTDPIEKSQPGPLDAQLHALLEDDPHPLSSLIRAATPWLAWGFSDLGGRIRDSIASGMMQTELLGPDGLIPNVALRVGLWVQAPQLDYPTRVHAAEETFVILGGDACWRAAGSSEIAKGVGEMIHHPSLTPHSDRTTENALLAAWRWSGDIAIEQYSLKG
jgi:hypothetical protein